MATPKLREEKANEAPPFPARPEPTEQEQGVIVRTRQKLDAHPQPPRISVQVSADGQPYFDASHADGMGWITHLKGTVGSNSTDYALGNLHSLTKLLGVDVSAADKAEAVNTMLAVISGAAPHNEVEGMLAVQMAASHQLAMTLMARVGRAEHIPMMESNGNMALKGPAQDLFLIIR